MPGRPRKQGKRYSNGRLSREARQEDARSTAVGTRMRQYGITETAAIERESTGEQLYGFPLGRLFKRQYISKAQYLAGNTFAEIMRSYLLSKGIGAPTAPAFDMDRRGASLTERPVQHEDQAHQFMEALREIDGLNPSSRSATALIWEICLREGSEDLTPKDLGVLREGLNAVGRVIQRREQAKRAA